MIACYFSSMVLPTHKLSLFNHQLFHSASFLMLAQRASSSYCKLSSRLAREQALACLSSFSLQTCHMPPVHLCDIPARYSSIYFLHVTSNRLFHRHTSSCSRAHHSSLLMPCSNCLEAHVHFDWQPREGSLCLAIKNNKNEEKGVGFF